MRRTWKTVAVATAALMMVMTGGPAQAAISDKRNDFNRDGISDFVAENASGYIYLYAGNGSGDVVSGKRLLIEYGSGYHGMTATPGDLNRDGVGDLVAIDSSNNCLTRWYGTGNSDFGGPSTVGCGWNLYADVAGAGDLNNDGNGDLLTYRLSDGCLLRYNGNGNGGFNSPGTVGCSGWTAYRHNLTGAGDLNRDGNGDVVAINDDPFSAGYKCLYRWYGDGSGGLYGAKQLGCGWGDYQIAGMGDFTGDGVGDLLAINYSNGSLYRFSGDGNGGFKTGVAIGSGFQNLTPAQ
ncbi:FG-GAP repeat domain-containing protein [Micromonospora sp. NPDC049366]|uniref:FG-GAP repeat domain-containing protein n=1 Tax=Micromonospora sp. NPDC049366 TaxID=3364271 RepID=UPI00379B757C